MQEYTGPGADSLGLRPCHRARSGAGRCGRRTGGEARSGGGGETVPVREGGGPVRLE